MKHIWLVTKYTDSTEELLSIHSTREGAILAAQEVWGRHDESTLSESELKRYREWKSTKDSFSCKFIDDDTVYEYRVDREELRR